MGDPKREEEIHELLDRLHLKEREEAASKRHAFWETQPVRKFSDENNEDVRDGPIHPPVDPGEVRQEPYRLPGSFTWCECDMSDSGVVEEVYSLLSENYVEDDDNMFRFNYSSAFLEWALQPPGFKRFWHMGIRVTATNKLVSFLSAIPATVTVNGSKVDLVEINFLCVHKKLRSKRLAPVMIREITRRCNVNGIWQAAYTAGKIIPTPIATCRYYHRSINPKKLIEVGFSKLGKRMTLSRTIKLHKLPACTSTPGLRPMQPKDVPAVRKLLARYLDQFKIAPRFGTDEEVAHWFLPRAGVMYAYVAQAASGEITDLLSFYSLPSTIIGNEQHKELRAAFSYYNIATSAPFKQVVEDALVIARDEGFDVFNALDLMENAKVLRGLKFGVGDGHLQYYLYNWNIREAFEPWEVGLVLL